MLGRYFCQFLPQIFFGTCRSVSLQWPQQWVSQVAVGRQAQICSLWEARWGCGSCQVDLFLTSLRQIFDPWRSNAEGKTMRNHNHWLFLGHILMRLNFLELGPASKASGLPPAVCQDPFGYDEGHHGRCGLWQSPAMFYFLGPQFRGW